MRIIVVAILGKLRTVNFTGSKMSSGNNYIWNSDINQFLTREAGRFKIQNNV